MPLVDRPTPTEYAPYYHTYVSQVHDGDVCATLELQLEETLALLASIGEARADYRYSPEKWSIKEVIGHVIDSERVFSYRAMRFARNDRTPLPSFEQDDYVKTANFDRRTLRDLATELQHLRRANILFFRSLDDEAEVRTGVASGKEVSVRALAFIIAGHERHHVRVIRERYLNGR